MSAAIEDMYLHKMNRKRNCSYSSDDEIRAKSSSPSMDDDRRAHHNELERRRRDHIKDHFVILKDAIPILDGEKSSRALILKRAVEYINVMQSRLDSNQKNMDELRRRNELLEEKLLERETNSCSPTSPRLPSLGATPMPMAQIVPIQQIPPINQLPTLPQNPIALSTMDPAHLNSLIASSQDAIFALTQSLLGNIQTSSPSLSDASSAGSPPGLYPCAYSPENHQMPIQF